MICTLTASARERELDEKKELREVRMVWTLKQYSTKSFEHTNGRKT